MDLTVEDFKELLLQLYVAQREIARLSRATNGEEAATPESDSL